MKEPQEALHAVYCAGVRGLRRRLPDTALGRVRLVAVVFGVLGLVMIAQVGSPLHPRTWHLASAVAIVLLGVVYIVTYRRERTFWFDPVAVPVLIVVGGSGLIDPFNVVGLTMGAVVALSPYGSRRAWVIRSIGAILTLPVVVAISPSVEGRPVHWASATVFGILPQVVLMTVMMRGVFAVMLRQSQAFAREAVLARAGSLLLGVTDSDRVGAIGRQAAAELATLSPGVQVVEGTVPRAIGRRPLPEEVLDAFRNLGNQLALAEATCASHAELHHRAHHDALTSLPTRILFVRKLNAAMDADRAAGTCTVALLNIDLDDFKQINDVYGHAAGDELLVGVAHRLVEAGGPNSVAARFGGDEFAVLLTGLDDLSEAERIAERIYQHLIEPLRLLVATVSVGASIGVATAEPALTAGDLLRCADVAMYWAKARGKSRVERFDAERHGEIARHRILEEHLAYAVGRDEIVLYFQPYFSLRTGECTGIEALACWQHPTLGLLQPHEFLPAAERTGQSASLGTHVLRRACRELASWLDLPGAGSLRIGVNVAARQVLDPGFASTVTEALAAAGLPPERLVLEVVESQQLDDPMARAQLQTVTAGGVRLAMDEFGTGYVSFGSLRSLPFSQIKIASTFMTGPQDTLRLVVSVAQLLGAEIVVQGIDTAERVDAFLGVTSGQGTQLAAPMPAGDVREWLAAGPPGTRAAARDEAPFGPASAIPG
jgi:diguanylate cyclase (GGDEF)-like protein